MQIYKHFRTITKHRHKVVANCFRAGIPWRGLMHDLSKYSPVEFFNSARHYQGFQSPNNGERMDYGYSKAWLHHKGRNRHHYEYWQDNSLETGKIEAVEMPLVFVKEMLCDRIAASKTYKGDKYTDTTPLEYFQGERGRANMHPATEKLIGEWLNYLAENGEDKLFAYIRTL